MSESGKPTYTTKAGGLDVSIPQNFSDGQKITAQNKGYEISFGVNVNQNDVFLKTAASVVELDALSSNTEVAKLNTVKSINNISTTSTLNSNDVEAYNAELMTVDNQSSAVTYKEIMPDTDFEYIVTSNSIKENIVVCEPQSEYIYSFDMDFDGLTPVINPDNSISLIEPSNLDETIFFIEAPYMYDSNNEESIDIEMSLVSNGDEYVMTLVANAEWINSSERVFPIVIDPTIQLLNSSISDVFVIDGLYANSPRMKNELRVGRNLTNVTRTYVKVALPTIPTSSVITSANFTLVMDYFFRELFEDDVDIRVYDCYNVAEWDPDTISWNEQPFNNSKNGYKSSGAECLDSIFASGSKTNFVFDITEAVQRWYDTGINNGLMFASSDEIDKVQIDFHSSRASDSANRPSMTFTYLPSGVNTSSVTFDATSSTSQPITVTSSKEWLITTDQSWLTTTPTSGTGTASFVINVSENTSVEPRTGIVLISSGGSVIGTVNVTQLGAASKVIVEKENILFDCQGDSQTISVVSNTSWNVFIEESAQNWLSAEKDASGNNIIITTSKHNGEGHRTGKITVETNDGNDSKKITIKQLDYVDFYFNEIGSDGNIAYKSSSDYNQSLATWAMELSYAAYNPISNELIPGVPSGFMQGKFSDKTFTAESILENKGFKATMFNYDGDNQVAAHVIGHREIDENTELSIFNSIGEIDNGFDNLYNDDLYVCTSANNDNSSSYSELDNSGNRVSNFNILTSTSTEVQSNSTRPLVVVAVRGSVTLQDWIMDAFTQFHVCALDFETGKDMVLNSLYHGTGDTENCLECSGNGCEICKGYIPYYNLSDPIILVTGHSLGAAVANLVAAELNTIEGQDNVFSYTFATPTVKSSLTGNATTPYTNIFNILNTNDVVTYLPSSLLLPMVDFWSRNGIDIPLNMPYSEEIETDFWGVKTHSMSVYMNWMEENKDISYDSLLQKSSESTVRGLLPIIFQIFCPVGVTVKDSNDNIIAYECEKEGLTYPETTNTGIVSWITDDGGKIFFIPSRVDVASVEIEAYDYGSMDFAVGTAGTACETEIKVLNDVSLYPGKEFLVNVSEDTLPEDMQLFITENGEIVGEVTETEPPFKSITVDYNNITYGTAIHLTIVTDNTVSEINLHNRTRGTTKVLVPGGVYVQNVTSDGDNLIWTVGYYPLVGENVYDISVKSGESWHYYENVIAISVSSNT